MEAEGEEYVVAGDAFIPGVEIAFGHGEGVSEVESAVHVGVGEGLEVLGFFVGLSAEKLISLPNVPGPLFERDEFVPPGGVLHVRIN